jgi:DNA polymerase
LQNKEIRQYLEYLNLSGIQDIFCSEKENDPSILLIQNAKKYSLCKRCSLGYNRTNLCYGNGSPDAKLMLIGEGPGAEEDKTGKVFVGRAGQLLTKMLKAINLDREEVYIANIVKCRPPGNRNPLPTEIEACLPYLFEQIQLVKPELLLLLGKVAAHTLLGFDGTMNEYRSKTYQVRNIKTFVTYHPSALLRNEGWKKFAWIDLQKLQEDYKKLK